MKILTAFLFLLICAEIFGQIKVSTDYEGANAIVRKIDGTDIWIKPDLRDTDGWWFYWNMEVSGAAGKKIRVFFENDDAIGNQGPAYSLDGGKTWAWLGSNSYTRPGKDNKSAYFTHEVPSGVSSVRYCFSIPYTLEDFKNFYAKLDGNPNFKMGKLATTLRGNDNFYVSAGNKNAPVKIVILARQHCCEASASYLFEGILSEIFSDTPCGKFLTESAEIFAVPFVDLDGVRAGDQGKNRRPHDHNRDYSSSPIYPSVRAIMERCASYGADAKIIAIDFHCPGWRERKSYFYYPANPRLSENVARLASMLEDNAKDAKGALPYNTKNDIPYGSKTYNSSNKSSFRDYINALDNAEIATTFEFAYSDTLGEVFSPQKGRNFGRVFARTIAEYIRSMNEK